MSEGALHGVPVWGADRAVPLAVRQRVMQLGKNRAQAINVLLDRVVQFAVGERRMQDENSEKVNVLVDVCCRVTIYGLFRISAWKPCLHTKYTHATAGALV